MKRCTFVDKYSKPVMGLSGGVLLSLCPQSRSRGCSWTWRFTKKEKPAGRVWEKKDASGHPSEARGHNSASALP